MLDVLITSSTVITVVIGGLAALVYVIVEQTKEITGIKQIPTRLYTILVSTMVTYLTLFGCLMYDRDSVPPSLFIFAILGSFVIAFIADNGWQALREIKDRFIPKGGNK